QTTIFNGGILNGNVSGSGKINVNIDSILNGNVDISSTIKIDNNATLSIVSGNVEVSIRGSSDGVGAVNFTGDNTLLASVGTSTTTLHLIEISNNSILNTSNKNIDTNFIRIGDGSTLSYGNGTILGQIDGSSANAGSLIFTETKTTNFDIGQNNPLSLLKISSSKTATFNGNIASDQILIDGKLTFNGSQISANDIVLSSGSTLNVDFASNVSGSINGDSEGNGMLQFSGSGTKNQTSSIGENFKLEQILISNQTTLNITDDIHLNADEITIGESGTLASGILTQNNGTIGSDQNSLINIKRGAIFNYNGGVINGSVSGSSTGNGTFNVNNDYISNFKIGSNNRLENLNIASQKTLTANDDIAADNILIAGTLNLGDSSKTITGSLATSGGAAIIDLGSAAHEISGNFSAFNGDILRINALNNSNVGSLTSAGNVVISGGIGLQISYDSDSGYLSDGSEIAIVSGVSGNINNIFDSNIDVNNSSSNQSGLLTFNTKKSGTELFLVVDRKGAESFTNNKFSADLYNNIDKVGSSATDELRNLQKFIDRTSTTNSQRDSALQSIIPQNNQDLNNSSLDSAKSSIKISSARLEKSLFKRDDNNFSNFLNGKNPRNFSNFSKKENIANLDKLNFSDDIFDDQAIWIQGFGSSSTQDNVEDSWGYEYSAQGLAVGVDQEIAKNLRLGVSSSFSLANIESNSVSKKETDIDSYQFNLYGGYNFEPYFISGIIGVAVNKYSSVRSMPEINQTATATYGGETYVAKFDGGVIKKLDYGFVFTPRISLTMARNQISTYSESGAGTLNLQVSNEKSNFLEGRFGADLRYDEFEILSIQVKPKMNLSYGYDFAASDQSSINKFQGQNTSFRIKNSNIDKKSLKYGFGFDIYEENGILMMIDYEIEKKPSYKSQSGSLYLRYSF
ncbi:MAG: hypothetical protein ACJATU_000664, partial [Rickettsiales bacterium]